MGFYEFIKNLQEKPDAKKRRMLISLILVSFIILMAVLIIDLKGRMGGNQFLIFGPEDSQDQEQEKNEILDNVLGPVAAIKEGFELMIKDIKEKSDELFSETENISQPIDQKERISLEERKVYKLPEN